ncbi:hypothetical protein P691DRAFT_655466 [Macrolepiota fuliginosa MF-IS2]|uniref:Phytochrome n=1 Tax=Macrolepiota fuliginosa MF-IS2 TaxID=1400762 RepID=A0A9P5XQT7_9AGAR|nr:hypothetical protein P691DRAFT_655466 [Macrolepiota fuliginosa MF-IS2]
MPPGGSDFTSRHATSSLSSSIDGARSKEDPTRESRVETPSSSELGSGGEEYVNFRFQYATDEYGNHVVIGREGKLERCEDEVSDHLLHFLRHSIGNNDVFDQPIRTPGAVQGFGVLIAVEDKEDVLIVRQVSENSTEILGLSPRYLFSLECFTDTLPENSAGTLWDNIQFLTDPNFVVSEDEDASPHIFVVSGWGEPGSASDSHDPGEASSPVPPQVEPKRQWSCWCAVHRAQSANGSKPGLIILEFELESDNFNPLYPTAPAFNLHCPGSTSQGFGSSSTLVSSPNVSSSGSTVVSDGNAPSATAAPQATTCSSTWSQYTPHHSLAGLEGQDDWVPSAEDIFESTTSYAKPLPALERLRRLTQRGPSLYEPSPLAKSLSTSDSSGSTPSTSPTSPKSTRPRRRGSTSTTPVGMMDVFAVMAQINEQLGTAQDLDMFLKVTVGIIKDLTGFHRVLAYQFDEVWNGQAVAELVDWGVTRDLYRGLHFPATDIPKQQYHWHLTYFIDKVRVLYDRSQPTARIVVRDKIDLEEPLNMTHCYLRAMSPIHIKYLENMGVRASMSVSIMAFDQLWGLVTCHSYGNVGMRVSFPVRQMLRLLSQSISRNIERLSYTKRLHTRKLINTLVSDYHPAGYIISNTDDLLGLFDADFGILVIGDGAKILGPNQHGQEILIMAEYLRLKQFDTIKASQAVIDDFPDLQLTTGLEVIAGLLYVPLSSEGKDFIAFLRRGQPRDIHWAGKPFKSASHSAQANLEPRKSFKIWSETVAGRCRVWTDDQLETAGVLALVYGKFIEVWRQRQSALQATKLTNLLLSNATHEGELVYIQNYLEMAMNGPLDNETRDNLVRSHAASKSLLFTINDLLDLTRLESGNETSFNEPFDLHMTIEDAVHIYRREASRRNLQFNLDVSEGPQTVVGDSRKIRTVVQNLTANALKYTETGSISVSCKTFGEPEGLRGPKQTAVEIVVADTGCGIQEEKLENIFREFEQVESSEPRSNAEAGVGLGLAVVARIVEQLGGQLRVDSRVGAGSRFSFLIPLALFLEGSGPSVSSRSSGSSSAQSQAYSRASSLPRSMHDEIDGLIGALSSNRISPRPPSTREGSVPAAGTGSASVSKMVNRGTFDVKDSQVPTRPVKVDYYDQKVTRANRSSRASSENTQERAAPPARLARRESQVATAKREKLRILIVEDNDINRAILAKRLSVMGHTVVNATNGQECIDIVKSDNGFDAVLMDIQMPIMDGFEATRKIRVLEPGPNEINTDSTLNAGRIPVFAVSASLMEQQRGDLINCGMDGWILKPIDFKRLGAILRGVMDVEQKKRDIYRTGGNWEVGGWLVDRTSDPQ